MFPSDGDSACAMLTPPPSSSSCPPSTGESKLISRPQSWRDSVRRSSSAFGSRVGRSAMPDDVIVPPTADSATRLSLAATIDSSVGKIGWFQLAFIAYSFTAAGPFGIEEAVHAVGPMWTFVGLFSIPLVYVLPQILITTEMIGMMPSPHGASLWVARAWPNGPLGYFNSISFICTNLVETAIYPALATDYIVGTFYPEADYWHKVGISYGIILFGTLAALASAKAVGHMSTVLSFLVMMPFFIGCGFGFKYWNWDKILESRSVFNGGEYQYGLAFSTLLWLFTGWRSLGSLGEDVREAKDFLRGLPLALVLGLVSYSLPLAVALSLPQPAEVEEPWDGGYIALSFDSALSGLGKVIGVAGALGNIGLFSTCMLCYPRMIWGAAERGWLPRFFTARWESTRSPWAAVLLHVLFALTFVLFDFSVLMRLQTMISVPAYVLGHLCLAKLRWSEPDAYRPVKWPSSFAGSIVLVSVPTMMFIVVTGMNFQEEWWLTTAALGVDVLIVLSYYVLQTFAPRFGIPVGTARDSCAETTSLLVRE